MLVNANSKCNSTVEWFSVDSEASYSRTLKLEGPNWDYKDKLITYTFNQNGYRCPNWSEIAWQDSIVMIGCSNTFGLGLNHTDTAAYLLSQKLNIPVINLGVVGSSNQLMLFNSIKLLENQIKPKAAVILFSDTSRYTHFNLNNNSIKSLGHWTLLDSPIKKIASVNNEMNDFYFDYLQDQNDTVHGTMAAYSTEAVWKAAGIKTLAYSAYFNSLKDKFKILPARVDTAREQSHPGINTNKLWADIIKNDLQI
jgi:hypothetical protein